MYAENLISTPEAQADFYPTPKELGKKMLQGIDLGFISTVLEPSAGKGDLIRCLAEESIAQEHRYNPHTLNVDAIEIDPISAVFSSMNLAVPDGKKFSIPCADLKIVPVTITNSTKRLV